MNEKKSYEILVMAENNDGYISVSEAKAMGIAQTYLVLAEEEGQFKKIAKGLYIKRGFDPDPYYVIHYKYKKAVFSLLSAAYLHGLCQKPKEIYMFLPRNYMSKGIKDVSSFHVGDKEYSVGLSLQVTSQGKLVSTYDIERTFVDLVRYRNRFQIDIRQICRVFFQKNYRKDVLFEYAKTFSCVKEIELLFDLFSVSR